MSKEREALRLTLAVLKAKDICGSSIREAKERAIAAAEEALAQPAVVEPHKQEPVPSGVIRTLVSIDKDGIETWKHEPFYTTPPTQCKHCLQRSKDEL